MKPKSAAAVFQVTDLDGSLRFYKDVLGFSEDFRFGDYAGIKLGDACLHLTKQGIYNRPIGGGTVYVFCDEVDGYFAEISGRGANTKSAPKNYDYGMRDFTMTDQDGNHLTFGCEVVKD